MVNIKWPKSSYYLLIISLILLKQTIIHADTLSETLVIYRYQTITLGEEKITQTTRSNNDSQTDTTQQSTIIDQHSGKVLQKTSANQSQQQFTYDGLGRLQAVFYGNDANHQPIEQTTQYQWQLGQSRITVTAPNHLMRTKMVNSLGQTILQCDNIIDDQHLSAQPCQHVTKTLQYNDLGEVATAVGVNQQAIDYQYDAMRRKMVTINHLADGNELMGYSTYNDVENSVSNYSESNGLKSVVLKKMTNSSQRQSQVITDQGTVITQQGYYDNWQNRINERESYSKTNSYQTKFSYDAQGQVITATRFNNPQQKSTTQFNFTYDLVGNVTKKTVTVAGQQIIPYQLNYDGNKRLLSKTLFGKNKAQRENYDYNNGVMQGYTDWSQHKFSFDYVNVLGKPRVSIAYIPSSNHSAAYAVVTSYDLHTGNITQICQRTASKDCEGEIDYTYTVDNQPATITYTDENGRHQISKTYDSNDRQLATVNDINNNKTDYYYRDGHVISAKMMQPNSNLGVEIKYTYDGLQRKTQTTRWQWLANGEKKQLDNTLYGYNKLGEIEKIQHIVGEQDSNQQVTDTLDYHYYRNGKLSDKTENYSNSRVLGQQEDYQEHYDYNAMKRVVKVTHRTANQGTTTTRYVYDINKNRRLKAVLHNADTLLSANKQVPMWQLTHYRYNGYNQLTYVSQEKSQPAYDGNGNLIRDDQNNRYTYNAENQRLTSTDAQYAYYANGNRRSMQYQGHQLRYFYDAQQLLNCQDEQGNTSSYFVVGNQTLAKFVSMAGVTTNQLFDSDLQGNITGTHQLTSNGLSSQHTSYSSYGAITKGLPHSHQPLMRQQLGYTGEYRDPSDSDTIYLKARDYNTRLGCFYQRDDCIFMNPYVYTDDDPINGCDPSGHVSQPMSPYLIGAATAAGVALTSIVAPQIAGVAFLLGNFVSSGVSAYQDFKHGESYNGEGDIIIGLSAMAGSWSAQIDLMVEKNTLSKDKSLLKLMSSASSNMLMGLGMGVKHFQDHPHGGDYYLAASTVLGFFAGCFYTGASQALTQFDGIENSLVKTLGRMSLGAMRSGLTGLIANSYPKISVVEGGHFSWRDLIPFALGAVSGLTQSLFRCTYAERGTAPGLFGLTAFARMAYIYMKPPLTELARS